MKNLTFLIWGKKFILIFGKRQKSGSQPKWKKWEKSVKSVLENTVTLRGLVNPIFKNYIIVLIVVNGHEKVDFLNFGQKMHFNSLKKPKK